MEINPIHISGVIIEITRKCNMHCIHCLRGKSENIDIKIEYVEKLFRQLNRINKLSLSGGEPSLCPDKINKIADLLKKYPIVDNFGITTNGRKVTSEFISSISNLYNNCLSNELSSLRISKDYYHSIDTKLPKKNINILFKFPFTSFAANTNSPILSEGNAKINKIGVKEIGFNPYYFRAKNAVHGRIYLNCLGNVVPSCDLSYKRQNNKKLILGNVNDKNFNLLNEIKTFNKKMDTKRNIYDR